MQVELHIQPRTVADRAPLTDFARCAVQLEHPALVKILDVCIDEAGRVVLVTPAAAGHWSELHRVASFLVNPSQACSIALSLAEALEYLHRMQFRGGMSLSWNNSVRAVQGEDGGWHLGLMPPTPDQIALALTPTGFAGVARYGAPELLTSAGTNPTPASDSFTLGALLFELLTGECLIRAKSLEEVIRELLRCEFRKVSDLRSDLPGTLGDFLARALGREPNSRPSLPEWSSAMKAFGGRLLPQPASTPGDAIPEPRRGERPRLRLMSLRDDSGRELRLRLTDPPRAGGFGGLRAALRDEVEWTESWKVPFSGGDRGLGANESRTGLSSLAEEATEAQLAAPPIPASIALQRREQMSSEPGEDPVDCTVFAPPKAGAGESILVQIFAHKPDQDEEVIRLAHEADETARRLGFRSLEVEIPRGARLQIELTLPGIEIDDSVQQVVWRGRTTSVQFAVDIPRTQPPGNLIGRVAVYLEGVPIGHIRFKLEITAGDQSRKLVGSSPLGEEIRRYTQAFLSYAMKDLDEVMKRVQMLARCHIGFFQDLLTLEPGDRWEQKLYEYIDHCDVFMLFWSTASKESQWVRKECEYALKRKGSDDSTPPEIVPIIIEGPPVPLPPPELSHIHFNDRLIYYMRRAKTQ